MSLLSLTSPLSGLTSPLFLLVTCLAKLILRSWASSELQCSPQGHEDESIEDGNDGAHDRRRETAVIGEDHV